MSIDITIETPIALPVDEVFRYVIEPGNEPDWINGIKESERVTPGPIVAGSNVRRVAAFMGRRIEYTPEVVAFEPNQRLLMKTDKPFPMTIEYAFREAGGRTTFSQRLQGGPRGIADLFSPVMAIMVRRNVSGDMARLRRILERDR